MKNKANTLVWRLTIPDATWPRSRRVEETALMETTAVAPLSLKACRIMVIIALPQPAMADADAMN